MRTHLSAVCALVVAVVSLGLPVSSNAQDRQGFSTGFLFTTISGVNASPILNYDFSVSTYQLVTTNLRFDEKNDRQKLNFAPFKLRRNPLQCSVICELTINLVRSKDGFTFGLGHAINPAAPYTTRARKAATTMVENTPSLRPQETGESQSTYDTYVQGYYRMLDSVVDRYAASLIRRTLVVSYGLNLQTFPVIGGAKVDLDGDGLIDNAHAIRSFDLNGGVAYSPSLTVAVNATYFFTRKRAASVEGNDLTTYHSVAVSFGVRAAVLDADYRSSDAYKKKGFIPSLVLGGQIEGLWCRGGTAACENQTTRSLAATPFVDVKLTPDTQFRFGVPLQWNRTAGKGSTNLLPIFQLGVQLAAL